MIIEEFKGVRNIPGIKKAKKKVLITKMKNDKRECITFRKGIALPTSSENSTKDFTRTTRKMTSNMKLVVTEEFLKLRQKNYKTKFAKLKKGKSPNSNGIRAEDIKACDDETRETVRQIFNEIIKRNNFTPDEWKKVKIKVIHKKGDVENVSNYRPICSLLASYKLLSTILLRKITPKA